MPEGSPQLRSSIEHTHHMEHKVYAKYVKAGLTDFSTTSRGVSATSILMAVLGVLLVEDGPLASCTNREVAFSLRSQITSRSPSGILALRFFAMGYPKRISLSSVKHADITGNHNRESNGPDRMARDQPIRPRPIKPQLFIFLLCKAKNRLISNDGGTTP